MERRFESFLKDSIKPVSIKETQFILEQMKTCVCKIHLGSKKGTGFFIKIPFQSQSLKVLMTNNHVIGEEELSNGKKITISLNNEESTRNIKIDSTRKIYTNEILDITIIEILEKDNIKNFLTLDKQILDTINLSIDDNSVSFFNNYYKKESIYVLNYISNNDTDEIFTSYGLLDIIDGNEIRHKCDTGRGSSGSPILLLKTKKVIGIHCGGSTSFNLGLLLIKPLLEFQNISSNFEMTRKNKGINNSNSISEIKNNNINIRANNVYNDLKNYYLNEMDIINKVNNPTNQGQIYQGFLVDKIWIDKWKKYSNYDFIKTNYFLKNFNDENVIKKLIINYLSNNNLNYDEIKDVQNYIIKDINQLKLKENSNKSYVLLNFNFLREFPFKENIAVITFYLSYQNIQIRPLNMPVISFKSNNNIIINKINFNNEYSSEYLKHLIRFTYLKGELHSPSNFFKKNFSQAYIINSEIIDKLNKIYNLKELIISLKNSQILNGFTYQNFDDNYSKITNFLNETQINYINSIKLIEAQDSIKLEEKEVTLDIKYLSNQIKLKYFDGFEIIGTGFATFLKKKFSNIIMHPINFVAFKNKFLTVINQEEQYYYEIISLDSNNNLTFECLLQIVVNNIFKDKSSLNTYIFNFLIKNELNNLKSKGNPISLENNKFKYYLKVIA